MLPSHAQRLSQGRSANNKACDTRTINQNGANIHTINIHDVRLSHVCSARARARVLIRIMYNKKSMY